MNKAHIHNGDVLVSKPWGQYTDIYRSDNVVFKRIDISPGEEISYQHHQFRHEFWYVTSGEGIITLDDKDASVEAGYMYHIKPDQKHQIKNTGTNRLTFFEMQCGMCSENDIVRISDKYER